MTTAKPVRDIERVFEILAAVAETGAASMRDTEQRTGLPRPTIVRIAQTLLEQGSLRCGLRDERYHLGKTLAVLAQRIGQRELLAAIAATRLNALSVHTGWPSVVAVFEPDPGEYMLVLNRAPRSHASTSAWSPRHQRNAQPAAAWVRSSREASDQRHFLLGNKRVFGRPLLD